MTERNIEVLVQPAYIKFGYIYVPARHTAFFPPGRPQSRRPIQIDTDTGVVQAELQHNSRGLI